MWSNLKNWQKSGIILVATYFILYILGILFVPLEAVDHAKTYKWPPLIYAIFLVWPILIIKYSQQKLLKIAAGIILGIFLFTLIVPFALPMIGGPKPNFDLSPIGIFSVLYTLPLIGGLLTFMVLFGLTM